MESSCLRYGMVTGLPKVSIWLTWTYMDPFTSTSTSVVWPSTSPEQLWRTSQKRRGPRRRLSSKPKSPKMIVNTFEFFVIAFDLMSWSKFKKWPTKAKKDKPIRNNMVWNYLPSYGKVWVHFKLGLKLDPVIHRQIHTLQS